MIRNIWNALFGEGGELDRFRAVLVSVAVATAVGLLLILMIRPSIGVCIWITLLSWMFSAYRLFSINRLVGVHLTGEGLEAAEALATVLLKKVEGSAPDVPAEKTGIFDNPLIRTYLRIITVIFFIQTALFLMSYLYVNYTTGGITEVILIIMLSTVLIIAKPKTFTKGFAIVAVVMVLVYSVGLVPHLFPQIGFHTRGITEKIHIVPASTAQIAEEIKDLQAKQLEEIDNKYLNQVLEWQKANPGKEPPQWFKDALAKKRSLI